ncbi:MAG: hypothetical protein AVDCRST_MAG40-840, partial [uncultured Gemmatimonadaceae bacterium]
GAGHHRRGGVGRGVARGAPGTPGRGAVRLRPARDGVDRRVGARPAALAAARDRGEPHAASRGAAAGERERDRRLPLPPHAQARGRAPRARRVRPPRARLLLRLHAPRVAARAQPGARAV